MEQTIRFLKKIIPSPLLRILLPYYHFSLAFLGGLFYSFPSYKMTVIGVTGTKGKTTTANLIAQILNRAGYKTGLATTVNFQIGGREWVNQTKQTMLGRFKLQKLLAEMLKEKCEYAVIETSSEGILQYRQRFIDYDVGVFTNLSPEHIERHAGFHGYRSAKVKLFEQISRKPTGIGVYNLDDENAEYFLKPAVSQKIGYTAAIRAKHKAAGGIGQGNNESKADAVYQISNIELEPDKTTFSINGEKMEMPLLGLFNVYNAAAAVATALALGIPVKIIKEALAEAKPPAGRMEIIDAGKFKVIIDYAHEPLSLEGIYRAITTSKLKAERSKLICLLGAQGGGRDKWKRPAMGKIAAEYCDEIILTSEDPYDEPPLQIINDIAGGFPQITNAKSQNPNTYKIVDRKEAIQKAISLAKKGDAVVLTGKGGERWMCVGGGGKIPWDERGIVEEILNRK